MSFFITGSRTRDGGNLGDVEAADAHCAALARAAGSRRTAWRAYLSTIDVDAPDRIDQAPRANARGAQVAANLDDLHGPVASFRQTPRPLNAASLSPAIFTTS